MQPDTAEIFESFRQFVNTTLARYKNQFRTNTPQQSHNLFQAFWKPFFDELLTECNRLYQSHKENMENPRPFARELQRIAEQGLVNFKGLTQSFAFKE